MQVLRTLHPTGIRRPNGPNVLLPCSDIITFGCAIRGPVLARPAPPPPSLEIRPTAFINPHIPPLAITRTRLTGAYCEVGVACRFSHLMSNHLTGRGPQGTQTPNNLSPGKFDGTPYSALNWPGPEIAHAPSNMSLEKFDGMASVKIRYTSQLRNLRGRTTLKPRSR